MSKNPRGKLGTALFWLKTPRNSAPTEISKYSQGHSTPCPSWGNTMTGEAA